MSAKSSTTAVAHNGTAGITSNAVSHNVTDDPEKNIAPPPAVLDWNGGNDPDDPLTWKKWKRIYHIYPPAVISFTATFGSSVYTPAVFELVDKFNVSTTVALLPLSFYVFALGFGPLLGAPLSETYGRRVVYLISAPVGAIFSVGAGFSQSIATLCVLRFFAGVGFSPALAIGAGTIADLFKLEDRAAPSALFIMMPFLGPALGFVIGSFVAVRKGWRWTQWTLVFFAICAIILTIFSKETYKKVILLRRAKRSGLPLPPGPPAVAKIKFLISVTLIRPLHMLFTEPIVAFMSLYTGFNFSVLFAFFAAFPYVYRSVYKFSTEQVGLVFLAVGLGVVLSLVTVVLCDRVFYQPRVRASLAEGKSGFVPPEYRLYPALFGCFGMPISLFWFGWTARRDISWASPVLAAIPFGWANLCIFIATATYLVDTYQALNSASAMAANGILRYTLGAVFPLFTIQMYSGLGIGWASTLLGFAAIVLIPVPWVLFKWGHVVRRKSGYDTIKL